MQNLRVFWRLLARYGGVGRMSVRQLWKAKLEGTLAPRAKSAAVPAMRSPFRGQVLGIDPSLRGTGLALVEFSPGRPAVLLRCQTVRVPQVHTLAQCLGEIFRAVASCLDDFPVDHVVLEQTIYVQNVRTAQVLGAARGAAIAAAALKEKPVFEYAPLRIKQAVVGVGRASKEQVAGMVMGLLGHGRTLAFDEADAAAAALCHAFTWRG